MHSPAQGFDLLVIGGGINGVAIVRECARRGLKAILVEQNDFGSGTTSRSTRIIHGGLRYLEQGEIGLVRESLHERERLLRDSPHLVRPLQFLLVLPRSPRHLLRSSLAVRTGLWLYHRWAGGRKLPSNAPGAFERALDSDRRFCVYSYEDAQCEFPERLVAEWLAESIEAGAVVRNHTELLEITRANSRVTGARLRDCISGQEYSVAATNIVNASGPWVDRVLESSGVNAPRLVGGIRGSHVVLPAFKGMSEKHAAILVDIRNHCGRFASVQQLHRLTNLPVSVMRKLAEADAFSSLKLSRREALWQVMKLSDEELPLWESAEDDDEIPIALPKMPIGQEVMIDYETGGLSLKKHPLELIRD